jgi:hypothetical protein
MSHKTRYTALLIRWQDEGEQTRWRSTVENAYTGEKHHFLDKNELLRFLWHALYSGETPGLAEPDAESDPEKRRGSGRSER